MLRVDGLTAGYGRIEVLHQISLNVAPGEIVAVIGANGAGKTTLLRTLSGLIEARSGEISFRDEKITHCPAHERVKRGLLQVPEGRQIFAPLSVEDNLRLGAWTGHPHEFEEDLAHVFERFPALAEARHAPGGTLSGGQQQMLAMGRALMARPKFLLLDEPSMGLAPLLIEAIFSVITALREQGLSVLLIEQNAAEALRIANRGYVLETGRITHHGPAQDLLGDERVRAAYLGL